MIFHITKKKLYSDTLSYTLSNKNIFYYFEIRIKHY